MLRVVHRLYALPQAESGEDSLNAFAEGYYGASRVTRKWVLGSVDVDVDRRGQNWFLGRSGGDGARGGGAIVNRVIMQYVEVSEE